MSSLASSSAAGSSVAGVEEIRGHFPALSRRHNGFPVAYFDGPGGTQVPPFFVSGRAPFATSTARMPSFAAAAAVARA